LFRNLMRLLFVSQLCLPSLSVAQDESSDIFFSADGGSSLETVGTTRVTTLRGNVQIKQGAVEILGNMARVEQDAASGDLIKVTVEGEPARFSRESTEAADNITGFSNSIVYYNEPAPAEAEQTLYSVVEFIGDANFNRGRTALQCAMIKHIVETGASDSPGPCSGVFAPSDEISVESE
ncbi:MAG: LptA/OstA family protein, partial [Pseudohongiella nitratireducens]|nr:LptA/OstA family protein [Pseudohongiella nitratireducens]